MTEVEGSTHMEVNSKPQLHVWGIGLPNAVALAGLGLAVLGLWRSTVDDSAEKARELERFENKIEVIEKSREIAKVEYDKKITPLLDANVVYRVTFLEASLAKGLEAVNTRQDRFADALGDLRTNLSDLSTDVKLILQRFDNTFPPKKAEVDTARPQMR